MYIYLIKYNGNVIAATDGDESATAVIYQYMDINKDMDIKLFEKEPIRFFTDREMESLNTYDIAIQISEGINDGTES